MPPELLIQQNHSQIPGATVPSKDNTVSNLQPSQFVLRFRTENTSGRPSLYLKRDGSKTEF